MSAIPVSGLEASVRPKAQYRIARLDKQEIERRDRSGHCTYCNETGHSRRCCAAGRIMRKVPKRVLDARLRAGVCPLCGDHDADGHSKATCPQKSALQASLTLKETFPTLPIQPTPHPSQLPKPSMPPTPTIASPDRAAGDGQPNKTSLSMNAAMPTLSPPASPSPSPSPSPSLLPTLSRTLLPSSVPLSTADPDLIDLGNNPSFSCAPLAVYRRAIVRSRTRTPQNLLDTDMTEVVWGNVIMLPVVNAETCCVAISETSLEDIQDAVDSSFARM